MGTPSEKKIEANRANARKSTGPKTAEGKSRSRRNGLKHGFAAELLVIEADRADYEARLERWEREAGPSNVVEEHLIRRAAVGSVRLDRIEAARQDNRLEVAKQAVRSWESRMQARARKLAQGLDHDPSNVLLDLEATAFGCDWLIRQWGSIDATLRLGKTWDQRSVSRIHRLLGLPEGLPGPSADPEVRTLWILAAAMSPRSITPLPRLESEADLPTDPEQARAMLRAFVDDRVDRLEALREESWDEVEGPERASVVSRALAADTSKEGQLLHRYETAADRSTGAAIRQFLNLRDRRRRELLELSREARHCDIPRAPVGGGWWQEVDADPAPPGFARIAELVPTEPPPEPSRTSPSEPDPARAATDPLPRPSEPRSPRAPDTNPGRNPQFEKRLRGEPCDGPRPRDRRTGPSPSPDRPPITPPDRPR